MAVPENTSVPTISAQRIVGQTVTSADGTWTGSPTFAYQWQRGEVVYEDGHVVYEGVEIVVDEWEDIAGETSDEYTLVLDDYRHLIRLEVTGTNGDGSAVAYSEGSLIVTTPFGGGSGGALAPSLGSAFSAFFEEEGE